MPAMQRIFWVAVVIGVMYWLGTEPAQAVVILLGGTIYFLPWMVANIRHSPHQTPIFVLTLLLGWTLIGWVVAMVWAVMPVQTEGREGHSI